jgi:hypothetical protein
MRKLVAAASLAALVASAAPAAAQARSAAARPAAAGLAMPVARDGAARIKPALRLRAPRGTSAAVRGYFEG